MAKEQPPTVAQTKPNNEGSRDVKVQVKRKVTYVFKISSGTVSMPYALAVNGSALAAYKDKPKRVSGKSGKIIEWVEPGSKVSLYLNSDAHPSYRQKAVYEVTPNENDIIVTITEKKGPSKDKDTPVLGSTDTKNKVDIYAAPLTGDIWMSVSHKYTSGEVDGLMPSSTSAEIITAIKSIYDPLKSDTLKIHIPATAEKAARSISVKFEDSNNPKDNISNYELLTDGVTRVHPAGYAALFNAAKECDVTSIKLTSCWRPMIGSIAHRAGLGLDVNYIGPTRMNRQELRDKKALDTTNVSEEEKRLLKGFEDAKTEEVATKKSADKAKLAVVKYKNDPTKAAEVQVTAEKTSKEYEEAKTKRVEAEKKWNEERDKNEPTAVKAFRTSLLKCACVNQLFDPWFMDENTRDDTAPTPNMQKSVNEKLHAHHLHITVKESKIL